MRKLSSVLNISLAITIIVLAIFVVKYFVVGNPVRGDDSIETIYAKPNAVALKRVTPTELGHLMESDRLLVVLDVREREAYKRDHSPGAKNIPLDELQARGINELSPTATVVITCGCPDSKLSLLAGEILSKQGFSRLSILSE